MDKLPINELDTPECDAIERLPYLAPKVVASRPPIIAANPGSGGDGGGGGGCCTAS